MTNSSNNNQVPAIGYSLETFIGGPLKAVIESQEMLSHSTVHFIKNIGFVNDKHGHPVKPRTVPFAYQRTSIDTETKELVTEDVRIDVPLIALVKVPSLEIDTIHYSFSMELKSTNHDTSKLYGVVTAPKEATHKHDRATKINLDVHAKQGQTPEGLARVMDLMNQAIAPKIVAKTPLKVKPFKDEEATKEFIDSLSKEEVYDLIEKLRDIASE